MSTGLTVMLRMMTGDGWMPNLGLYRWHRGKWTNCGSWRASKIIFGAERSLRTKAEDFVLFVSHEHQSLLNRLFYSFGLNFDSITSWMSERSHKHKCSLQDSTMDLLKMWTAPKNRLEALEDWD